MTRARTRDGRFYNPATTDMFTFRSLISDYFRTQLLEKPVFAKGASVSVTVEFYLTCSGSREPDLDNLVKFVLDACNGLVYADDIQVNVINAKKHSYVTKNDKGKTHIYATRSPN